jgi:xanthine dehydrogenase small subunit
MTDQVTDSGSRVDANINHQLRFMINGESIVLENTSPTLTLLQYLHQSGRTGTKEGCGDGDCGACTVAIFSPGSHDRSPCYEAINSCLIPLGAIAHREVITVEGIAANGLHPVQAAMVETGGSQCGYCTPGFIMSLFAAYYQGQVDDVTVEGNLCRCTGYLPIRRATKMLTAATAADKFRDRLSQLGLPSTFFVYQSNQQSFYRPTHLTELLALLQSHPQAVLVAGGTDLGLDMSHHRQSFPVLISLEAVDELCQISQTETSVKIGAAVPLSHIQTALKGIFPSLDEMLHWFAACQVRNRATIGGNIGTASPIGDLPPVLLSLDAQVQIATHAGERTILLANFFQGYRQTDLRSGEVIVSIEIPNHFTPGSVRRFSQSYKIGKRGTDDISIVAAAFTIDVDENNQILHARLAYGGVAATPIRAIEVENHLIGQPWSLETIQQVKPMLRDAFTPLSDLRGSAEYRKLLVANLFEKFFIEVMGLA